MKIRRRSIMSSTNKDYASLRDMDFKKARDILTKDGFHEHEYGDKDDNNGYAVYRKGDKEVELTYEWVEGKRKGEAHAGKVVNVYVDEDINASCGKKSVKSSTYDTRLDYLLTNSKLTDEAANLYDGGWRDGDQEELMEEYGVYRDYADDLCLLFKEYERREKEDDVESACGKKSVKSNKINKRRAITAAEGLNDMKIIVKSKAYVDIAVDDYEQGALNLVNSWDFDVRGEYDTLQELIDRIADESYIFSNNIADYYYMDGRIGTSAMVDADNSVPTDGQYEAWKRGEENLYIADLYLSLEVGGGSHEMTEEEAEAFGLALY